MNSTICSNCNICDSLVPEQKEPRLLASEPGELDPWILVIDDAPRKDLYDDAMAIALKLLGTPNFAYTTTIRCDQNPETLDGLSLQTVLSHCSVWTNILSENRLLILSTKRGLGQLKIGAEREEGDAFKVGRLGVVLCIPSLLRINNPSLLAAYREKTKRVLREAGLEKK